MKDRKLAMQAIRNNPEIASEMAIKGRALEVYNCIKDADMSSRDVSDIFEISIHHANMILKKLSEKGYTKRFSRQQPSGGYEWIYSKVN